MLKLPKNAQKHPSHMLVKKCSKFSKPDFNSMWTVNSQMSKLDLEKAEEPQIKFPTSVGSSKKHESSRRTFPSALFTVWITTNWKILQDMGIADHLTCLLRNLYAGQEASYHWTWNNRLVPNQERSSSKLYIVILLIYLKCRVHHE